jgi:hypothetical protein
MAIEIIPGARKPLGWGFKVFGRYEEESCTLRLLDPLGLDNVSVTPTTQITDYKGDHTKWKYQSANIEYAIPTKVDFSPNIEAFMNSEVFQSVKDMSESFSAKANLSGTYKAFSGEVEAAMSSSKKYHSDNLYSVLETGSRQWTVSLTEESIKVLSKSVLADDVYKNLPKTYNAENRAFYFDFFEKYGTHYVYSVAVGFKLSCTLTIDKKSMQEAAHRSVSAEFRKGGADAPKGGTLPAKLSKTQYEALSPDEKTRYDLLVADIDNVKGQEVKARLQSLTRKEFEASVAGKAEWASENKEFSDNRTLRIAAKGGDPSEIICVNPEFDSKFALKFEKWGKSAVKQPASLDFKLRSVADIFSGAERKIMQTALDDYFLQQIFVQSRTKDSQILFHGKDLAPTLDSNEPNRYRVPPARSLGFQLAVINKKTLKHIDSTYILYDWSAGFTNTVGAQIYDSLSKYLNGFINKDYLIVIASRGMAASLVPTEAVCRQLRGMGASLALERWREGVGIKNGRPYPMFVNYVLVGSPEHLVAGQNMFEQLTYSETGSYIGNEPFMMGEPAETITLWVPVHQIR